MTTEVSCGRKILGKSYHLRYLRALWAVIATNDYGTMQVGLEETSIGQSAILTIIWGSFYLSGFTGHILLLYHRSEICWWALIVSYLNYGLFMLKISDESC